MKKLGVFLISIIIAWSAVPHSNARASVFPDVHNYEAEIGYLVNQNILTGYPDGTFKPQQQLTRLQGVRVLLKAIGVTDFTAPDPGMSDMTPTTYGYQEVAKAVQLGIISGKTSSNNTKYFDPSGKLTRGQMAKIIVKSMNYPINDLYKFRDVPKSNGFYNDISTLAAEKITTGYQDRTFKPTRTVSREHFAVFVARMLNSTFQQSPMSLSFLMDNELDYWWKTVENSATSYSTSTYAGFYTAGQYTWPLWHDNTSMGTGPFLNEEDSNGLYTAYPESHIYTDLVYPLYDGQTFGNPNDVIDNTTYTVISVNRNITTNAGNFTHVVEVLDSLGNTIYYAPNIGEIKRQWGGTNYRELINLTPN